MSQPDVITSEAAVRYADALIELAEETRGAMRGVERDMKRLRELLKSSPEFAKAMRSPIYGAEGKARAIQAIARKDGFHPLMVKFLGTVVQNRRGRELHQITLAFADQLAAKRGTQIARVASATPLTAPQLKQIKDRLTKELGKTVDVETDVDPDLLGGFVVRIGSRLYDASLRTQLDDLKLALQA